MNKGLSGVKPTHGPRALGSIVFFLSLVLALTACSPAVDEPTSTDPSADVETTDAQSEPTNADTTTTQEDEPRSLVVRVNSEGGSLHHLAESPPIGLLTLNVVEPLLERLEDGSLAPLLAESFQVSDDGLEYVFKIREATFHDGSDLTADDVVYSLEANRNNELNPNVSAGFAAVEAIEKIDERTVGVTLSRPSQAFIRSMSADSGLIIADKSFNDAEPSEPPVGTGPFIVGEWRRGVDIALHRFDDYWGDLPFFEDVTWRLIPDDTAAINAMRAGEVDLINQIAGDALDLLEDIDGTDGFHVVESDNFSVLYAILNADEPLLEDPRIRQAIAHAIDRQPLIDGVLGGFGEPTCVNTRDEPWTTDYCPYPHDPDRSLELLAEAGAEDLRLTLTNLTVGFNPQMTEILTSQFAEAGITVETRGLDLAAYLDEVVNNRNYQFSHLGGGALVDQLGGCPGFLTGDCVPEVDELLAQAEATTTHEEWVALRRQAAELHADRAYLIPMINFPVLPMIRNDLQGLRTYYTRSVLDLRHLRWEE